MPIWNPVRPSGRIGNRSAVRSRNRAVRSEIVRHRRLSFICPLTMRPPQSRFQQRVCRYAPGPCLPLTWPSLQCCSAVDLRVGHLVPSPELHPSPIEGIHAKFRLPLPPGEGWREGSQAGERRLGPASPSPRGKGDNRRLLRLNLAPMPIEGRRTTDGRKKPTRSTTAHQRSGSALNPEPYPHSPATIIGAFALKSIAFGRRGLRHSGARSREGRVDNRMPTDRSGECRRSEAQNASQGEPTGTGQQVHSVSVPLPPGLDAEFRCGRRRFSPLLGLSRRDRKP